MSARILLDRVEIDADSIQLTDGKPKQVWIQIARPGHFKGHSAGPFTLDAKVFSEIIRNFRATTNRRVAIDFEHASEQDSARGAIPFGGAPAQGWIVDLQERGDGLYGLVEWLPLAAQYIKAGQYKFFSPAIRFNSKDRVTGKNIGATLTSGALTNRPYLDAMKPLAARDHETQPAPAERTTTMTTTATAHDPKLLERAKAHQRAGMSFDEAFSTALSERAAQRHGAPTRLLTFDERVRANQRTGLSYDESWALVWKETNGHRPTLVERTKQLQLSGLSYDESFSKALAEEGEHNRNWSAPASYPTPAEITAPAKRAEAATAKTGNQLDELVMAGLVRYARSQAQYRGFRPAAPNNPPSFGEQQEIANRYGADLSITEEEAIARASAELTQRNEAFQQRAREASAKSMGRPIA